MKETLRHREAFDYYYSLGDRRALPLVATKFTVSRQSVSKWKKEFNWEGRVQQRDIDNARRIERKTDNTIVNSKADYRKDIKAVLGYFKAAINTARENLQSGAIKAESIDDMSKLAKAFDTLVKLDLLLMGEATERDEMHFKMELEGIDVGAFPDSKDE